MSSHFKSEHRVLFLIQSLGVGGAERVFTVILRHLGRSCGEPHLAVLDSSGDFMSAVPSEVVLHDLRASRVRYALPGIVRLAWRLRPRTILSTQGHLNLALLASRPLLPSGTRVVIRETVIPSVYLAEEVKRRDLWTWLYRCLYPRADCVVCLSDAIMDDLTSYFGIPGEKLVRIYNPVDAIQVRKLAKEAPNPYPGAGPHLVSAGRLTRQKGFDILIDSMRVVVARFPNATLTILGRGELEGTLRNRVRQLGLQNSVFFLEFQKNPWVYFKHADLFVLASRYEGMPNVLLEALALNTPAVATDCPGGVREIHELDDRLVLVPAENREALARAILSACQSPRRVDDEGTAHEFCQPLGPFEVSRAVRQYAELL